MMVVGVIVFVAIIVAAFVRINRGGSGVAIIFGGFVFGILLFIPGLMSYLADGISPVTDQVAEAFDTDIENVKSNGKWFTAAFDNAELYCEGANPTGRNGEKKADCEFTGDLNEYRTDVGENLVVSEDGKSAVLTLKDRTYEIKHVKSID